MKTRSIDEELNVSNFGDPRYETGRGVLFNDDCGDILSNMEDEKFDLVFLDPPFNLQKNYGEEFSDDLKPDEYKKWCKNWLSECVRILNEGGSLFLYHLPEKLLWFGNQLNELNLDFRHWIAIDYKSTYPSKNKLYPAHYGLLYYTKGDPNYFNRPKIPIEECRHCGGDIKDYGGYRKNIVENGGINLSDVWTDLSPVRHESTRNRDANELPEKMLERILKISTKEADLILDPFAGAGTSAVVAERMDRFWLSVEIGDCEPFIDRLEGELR
ncbi:MAG: site-specific DNA-methyltransferase [Flavobacteriales bacterium]